MGGNAMADQESCAGVGHAPTSTFGCWGAGLRTKSDWRDMRNVANAPAVCHEYTAGAIVFNNLDPGFCYRAVCGCAALVCPLGTIPRAGGEGRGRSPVNPWG